MLNYRLLATASMLFGLVSVNAAAPDPKVLAYHITRQDPLDRITPAAPNKR